MYGHVNTLEDTFLILGLAKRPVLKESKEEAKDKLERKRLIEEARQERTKATITETKPAPAKPADPKAPKSKLVTLAEEVQALSSELENAISNRSICATIEPKVEGKEMDKVSKSLNHVMNFSAEAVKKFEWRQDERSQRIATVFKLIREEADKAASKIKKGEIAEESVAKGEANSIIKRFIEAVGVVKTAFKINEDVFTALKESLKNVK